MDMENILMVARWEGCGGMGEEARGLKISSYRIAMGM